MIFTLILTLLWIVNTVSINRHLHDDSEDREDSFNI